jgi:hypothetical protein
MKQRILFFIASLFTGIIFLQISCTPGSCFEETNAYVRVFFYSYGTGKTLPPDSLTVYGLNMSSEKIYDKAEKKQPALLPLNASSRDCSFIIKINGKADIVTFTYSSYPHLISKECGYTFYHAIDTPVYSKNIIKTIKVINNTVTTLHEENIRIFY